MTGDNLTEFAKRYGQWCSHNPERVAAFNDGLIADSKGHFDAADYDRQLKHEADSGRGD